MDTPITDFSSEATDTDLKIAYAYGYTGFVPPLGSAFTSLPGPALCEAPTHEQAEACALANLNASTLIPTPGNPTQIPWPPVGK